LRLSAIVLLVAVFAIAPAIYAQPAPIRADRPLVVSVDFTVKRSGQRDAALNAGRALALTTGESVVVMAAPVDQYGRRFPLDRFRLDFEPAADCRGRLDVSEGSSGELRLRAGVTRGRCTVNVWVPGNLNLDYTLTFDVGGLGTSNYSREQAVAIIGRLYRAILQRDPDDASIRAAVTEVQGGNLQPQIEAIVRSAEFQTLRQQQTASDLLAAFYKGLFDREPDTAGVRQYLAELGRNRHAQVILSLVQSEEFERRLPR
jgi:hypothetical protein